MTELPHGLIAYKRTPTFTETTIPAGLLKDHSTQKGTWGLIHVADGQLRYFVTDATRPASECILTRETGPGVVEPAIVHRVEPVGLTRFWVEFWRPEIE